MLLRRFSQHLKAQNWLAVFLDLIIVVSGIFIALQVTNYSKELEEKAVLKEKLATLLVEGQEIIENTEAYPEQVKDLIINSDKLIKIIESCKTSDDFETLLSSLQSYVSMGEDLRFNIEDIEEHSSLLNPQFRNQLRTYKNSIDTLINHIIANRQLLLDMYILKSNYFGLRGASATLTLNQPLEEVCTKPDFTKYILLPKIIAEIEIKLTSEAQTLNIAFEENIKREFESLD